MQTRFTRYVTRLFRATLVLSVVCLGLYAAQSYYHPFDAQVAAVRRIMADLDGRLSKEALAGVSVGSLVLVVGLCFAPLLMRKIDPRGYLRGLWRGVVSASVFLASTELFSFAERASRLYLVAAIALVILATALLVEAVSLAARFEEERSMRTDIVASISSGLLFGVLVKLGQFALEWARSLV